jgi:hypothetical protein
MTGILKSEMSRIRVLIGSSGRSAIPVLNNCFSWLQPIKLEPSVTQTPALQIINVAFCNTK